MRPRAFTLIEMIVVIATLVLLAAMLFPVLARCREEARTVACCANIRQLTASLLNYEAENQSLPYGFDFRTDPPPGGPQGDARHDPPGWWWFHYAGVIRHKSWLKTGETKVLRCPSSRLGDWALDLDLLTGKYGVNQSLCMNTMAILSTPMREVFTGTPLSTGDLRSPGSTLLLADSGYSLICWWQATAEPPVPIGDRYIADTSYVPGLAINKDRVLWPGMAEDAVAGRHPDKSVNVGFADGHSERREASDLLVEKTEEGYTNTLLWHARPVPPLPTTDP
jgi:prepilin-type processing-associated H-X9-DG protein/prepilin-type N-terminal cleavage/methylation domain-containing protein